MLVRGFVHDAASVSYPPFAMEGCTIVVPGSFPPCLLEKLMRTALLVNHSENLLFLPSKNLAFDPYFCNWFMPYIGLSGFGG